MNTRPVKSTTLTLEKLLRTKDKLEKWPFLPLDTAEGKVRFNQWPQFTELKFQISKRKKLNHLGDQDTQILLDTGPT